MAFNASSYLPSACSTQAAAALPLDVDNFRPIGVLGFAQLIAQLGELGDVGLGGIRLAGTRSPERSGKVRDRHYEGKAARPDLQL
jgi:hypothetical protein